MRELKFQKPVSKSDLDLIIAASMKKLKFKCDWFVKDSSHCNGTDTTVLAYSVSSNLEGYISYASDSFEIITTFMAERQAMTPFYSFNCIIFKPDINTDETLEIFNTNIDKICDVFQKSYEEIKQAEDKNVS